MLIRTAGLAPARGEGAPANAVGWTVKVPRPAGDPFDLAAVLCGHDPLTVTGRSAARHDLRVWDLLDDLEGTR